MLSNYKEVLKKKPQNPTYIPLYMYSGKGDKVMVITALRKTFQLYRGGGVGKRSEDTNI